MASHTDDVSIDELLTARPGPFALIRRASTSPLPEAVPADRIDIVAGEFTTAQRLADLPLSAPGPGTGQHELLAVIPYRQLTERGFACRDDAEPILAMRVRRQGSVTVADAVHRIPDVPTAMVDAGFDVDDEDYAQMVRRILTDEIGHGEGANFVMQRAFTARIPGFSPAQALAAFRRLLLVESGAYWTFVVHTGSRTFIGASPERHVSLSDGTLVMNPISGTYQHPSGGPTLAGVLDFLADAKETNELYMVVDEELKMMANVCQSGIRVVGPYLKEMRRLAHTEYFLHGHSSMDVRTILRETMFAPTVTGSPLENACRVITRQERNSRAYYSGVLALISKDGNGARTLDSAILIRTADVGAEGRLRISVGATVVRDSDPATEAQETRAKAAALVSALDSGTATAHPASPSAALGRHPEVASALERRNMTLSGLWLGSPTGRALPPGLAGRRVLVVDAEDRFTSMLDLQLRTLGLSVTVQPYHRPVNIGNTDVLLVGPGPGDPRDHANPKIAELRQITLAAIQASVPLVSVCLGHQVLAGLLGFELVHKEVPNQGVQREIDFFGRGEMVGFYNSFAARSAHDLVHCLGLPRPIEVSRDPESGEVHALRGPRFVSMQFHPESVLTQNGLIVVGELISSMLERAQALAPSLSTF